MLLSKLRSGTNGAQWIPSTNVGTLFLNDVMPVLKQYVAYVIEYPKRMQALARLVRKVPEVRTVIDKGFATDGGEQARPVSFSLCLFCNSLVAESGGDVAGADAPADGVRVDAG